MKIVLLDPMKIFPEHQQELSQLGDFVTYDKAPANKEEILERVKDADVVINFWVELPTDVVKEMSSVKLIIMAASGYDWVDVDMATEKGVLIAHCPGHNAESVAEHTIGLILSASRHLRKAVNETYRGEWNSIAYQGVELKDKILGIVGYGHIGKRVGEIAENGFNMNVQHVDSGSTSEDLDNLLQTSDVISINAPLNEKTKGMINEDAFEKMKQDVVLVNTGRGAVIDESALIKAIKSGKVYAAGLDTLSQEPPEKDNPLFGFDNVIITPHTAWNTKETDYNLSEQIVKIVKAFVEGSPVHIITEQSIK